MKVCGKMRVSCQRHRPFRFTNLQKNMYEFVIILLHSNSVNAPAKRPTPMPICNAASALDDGRALPPNVQPQIGPSRLPAVRLIQRTTFDPIVPTGLGGKRNPHVAANIAAVRLVRNPTRRKLPKLVDGISWRGGRGRADLDAGDYGRLCVKRERQ